MRSGTGETGIGDWVRSLEERLGAVEDRLQQNSPKGPRGELADRTSAVEEDVKAIREDPTENDRGSRDSGTVASKSARPWRDMSIVIAFTALVFSFGTTAVSYIQTYRAAVQDDRAQLRVALQRLVTLPKENAEVLRKYDELSGAQLAGYLKTENTLVANQADEIMTKIPREYVTANDINVVASGFMFSGNYERAQALL